MLIHMKTKFGWNKMTFKVKELKNLNNFIQEIIKEYPVYNHPKYFKELMQYYSPKRYYKGINEKIF